MAANTDKLKKLAPKWTGNIGAAGVSNGTVTTIPLTSVSNLPTDTAVVATINRVDANSARTTGGVDETVIGVVSGNNLIDCVRGVEGTAQAHSAGQVVEILVTAKGINDIVDWGLVEHSQLGVHTDALVTSLKATGAEINTGTEDAKIVTPKAMADSDYAKTTDITVTADSTTTFSNKDLTSSTNTFADIVYTNSLSRQAIINGNFDVWQRGTSVAMTAANAYAADRWYCETATAGTDKTVSREDGTGVNGSYYCARVKMVGDVDELLTFSQALESQDSIKFRGQKVTLSFYARGGAEFVSDNSTLVSKIVTGKGTDQKVLAFTTSADGVSQNNTLTTSWVKFTCTTTAAIASDITQIGVSFAFTHAGAGTTTNYFEITQVQLCAGDVALPFMPKSFEEELRACQRYYEKSFAYATAPANGSDATSFATQTGIVSSPYVFVDWQRGQTIFFKVQKRAIPTLVYYGNNSGHWSYKHNGGSETFAAQQVGLITETLSESSFVFNLNSSTGTPGILKGHWTASAEL